MRRRCSGPGPTRQHQHIDRDRTPTVLSPFKMLPAVVCGVSLRCMVAKCVLCCAGGSHGHHWLLPPPAFPIAAFRPASRLVCPLSSGIYPVLEDTTLSRVACRQLGFPLGVAVYSSGISNSNSGPSHPSLPTWSDRALNCSGSEATVKMCTVQAARSKCDIWDPVYGSATNYARLGVQCYAGERACRGGWER